MPGSDDVVLIEPWPIEDEFCCGLARIEDLGETARFVLYTERTLYECGNETVQCVRAKVILPLSAIRPGIEMTLAFLARKAAKAAGDRLLRLVR